MAGYKVVEMTNTQFREDEREKERKANLEVPSRFSAVKELEKDLLRFESNNGSTDKETNRILSYRRDYHIDSTVWSNQIPHCVYMRIDKTGVLRKKGSRFICSTKSL
jgi:hypothetical protein